jgi:hypothetical protein
MRSNTKQKILLKYLFMDTNSYSDGRQGTPYSGGSYSDYEIGKRDSGNNSGGGGGGVHPILLILLIPVAAISAISSVFLTVLLQKYLQNIQPDSKRLTFGNGFKLLFITTFLYQISSNIIPLTLYWMSPNNQFDFADISLKATILSHLVSILISAIMLRSKLSNYLTFKGFSGYIRASLVTAILIMPIILLTNYIIMNAVRYYVFNHPNNLFH